MLEIKITVTETKTAFDGFRHLLRNDQGKNK